jgi:gluconolactonase
VVRRFFAVACVLAGSGIALGACSDANSGMGANAASGSSGAANPASASPAAGAGGTRAMVAAGGAGSSAANGGTNASATAGAGGAPRAGNAAVSGTGAGSGAGVSGGSSGTSALPMSGAGAGAAGGGGAGGSTAAASRCPPGPFGAPVPSGATPQRIDGVPPADAFNKQGSDRTNIEGAVWIGNTLYVSEFPFTPAPASRVLAIVPAASGTSATVSVAIADCGANGMAVDAQGNLVTTDHKLGAIVRYTFPLGTPATIVGTYDGKRFNSPNDLAIRSDGTIYFSDPDYQAPSMHPQMQTRFYRVAPGSSEARAIEQRSQPNGVTLSPDEKTLYVAGSDGILAYPVKDDGDIAPGSGVRVSGFNGGADGLAVDCAGNLYATSGQRVAVLSPSGMEIASIPVSGAESVTNVAFGGPERKTLFITSMGTNTQRGVFRVELNVPGMPY